MKYYYSHESPCDKCSFSRDKYPIYSHTHVHKHTGTRYTSKRVAIDDIRQE